MMCSNEIIRVPENNSDTIRVAPPPILTQMRNERKKTIRFYTFTRKIKRLIILKVYKWIVLHQQHTSTSNSSGFSEGLRINKYRQQEKRITTTYLLKLKPHQLPQKAGV